MPTQITSNSDRLDWCSS